MAMVVTLLALGFGSASGWGVLVCCCWSCSISHFLLCERERESGGAGGVNIKDAKSCRCV